VKIAVAIPSLRRPGVLADALAMLRAQTRPADEVWVAVTSPEDLPPGAMGDPAVHVVFSPRGIASQRNAIVDRISAGIDLLVFLDDDVELHPEYLARAEEFATTRPDVVLFTGEVVVDGAASGEIDRAAARRALAEAVPSAEEVPGRHGYGCNMAVRTSVARELRFDERLPLYGWLEDRDFSVRASRRGVVLGYRGCLAAHLGYSGGREVGVRIGFQQVVHPAYLRRKGVLRLRQTCGLVARALLANLVRPSSSRVDRPGRLRGNLHGLREVFLGDADPAGVHDLDG
jgi:GT2 family glycosyltransferase